MCTNQLNLAWKAKVSSHVQKLVLVSLADQANSDGVCWPGMRFIADRTGLNRGTILRNIRLLEAAGFLTVEKRTGGLGGGAKSNLYTLHISESCSVQHSGESCSDDSESCSVQPEPSLEPPLYIYTQNLESELKAYTAMRKQIKKPFNATATKLLINKLKKLQEAGYNPAELLETATANCWLSVYEPKQDKKQNGSGNQSFKRFDPNEDTESCLDPVNPYEGM